MCYCTKLRCSNTYEFPYNPDADNDAFISTTDLVEFLALFGQDFTSEELYLSADSAEAIVFVGEMHCAACISACNDLQGDWKIPSHVDLSLFYDELRIEVGGLLQEEIQTIWSIEDEALRGRFSAYKGVHRHPFNSNPSMQGCVEGLQPRECWCATKERPRVEYSVIDSSTDTFNAILNSMAEEGWLLVPQGPFGNAVTFWRCAD